MMNDKEIIEKYIELGSIWKVVAEKIIDKENPRVEFKLITID